MSINIAHIPDLQVVPNSCNMMLREVHRTDRWSIAHVMMNPEDESILHQHNQMTEAYVVTKGFGELVIGKSTFYVMPGSVFTIKPGVPHQLFNIGLTRLEHFVLATPAFDPKDVEELPKQDRHTGITTDTPKPVVCSDGARIVPYTLHDFGLSLAFGRVTNNPELRKEPHYHMKTKEWLYIVEGAGLVEIDGTYYTVATGDWICIEKYKRHAIRNFLDDNLVVVCICDPPYTDKDTFNFSNLCEKQEGWHNE